MLVVNALLATALRRIAVSSSINFKFEIFRLWVPAMLPFSSPKVVTYELGPAGGGGTSWIGPAR
ncbi:hypothetical protein [Sorangium cellulosum]|uniref:hypothetical protein n=1 Tax=Sorangium cellulosum TaxID=56 RepID=UPI0018F4EA1E|nr:hypothetical protein [Sorangium cellulosum]